MLTWPGTDSKQWFLVVFSFLSSIFLFSLDNTVLADLVPIIVNQFHRVDQISWLSVGQVTAKTCFHSNVLTWL